MAELTTEQKHAIVTLLACYIPPAEVVVAMREDHGVETDVAQIATYDPTKLKFAAGDWARTMFAEVRARFHDRQVESPIASQAYRLSVLQRNLQYAMKTGNRMLANQTLKQAAEEVGGSYTNEQRLKVEKVEHDPEDARREARDMINAVLKRKEGQTAPGTDKVQ